MVVWGQSSQRLPAPPLPADACRVQLYLTCLDATGVPNRVGVKTFENFYARRSRLNGVAIHALAFQFQVGRIPGIILDEDFCQLAADRDEFLMIGSNFDLFC